MEELESSLRNIGEHFELITHLLDNTLFDNFPEFFSDSKMTYARLLIPKIIDAPKILYIDTDLVCTRDFSDIWGLDLDSNVAAVVREFGYQGEEDSHLFVEEYPNIKEHTYFNGGLLLLNLDRIRKEGLFDLALEHLETDKEKCLYWDQSVLNVVFANKCKYLPPSCNFQLNRHQNITADKLALLTEGEANLHYVTDSKPWIKANSSLHHRIFKLADGRFRRDDSLVQTAFDWTAAKQSRRRHQLAALKLRFLAFLGWRKERNQRIAQDHLRLANQLASDLRNQALVDSTFQQLFL